MNLIGSRFVILNVSLYFKFFKVFKVIIIDDTDVITEKERKYSETIINNAENQLKDSLESQKKTNIEK
jgi:hypothetical protein